MLNVAITLSRDDGGTQADWELDAGSQLRYCRAPHPPHTPSSAWCPGIRSGNPCSHFSQCPEWMSKSCSVSPPTSFSEPKARNLGSCASEPHCGGQGACGRGMMAQAQRSWGLWLCPLWPRHYMFPLITHTHTYMCAHKHRDAHRHTCMHTYVCAHAHVHIHVHTHTIQGPYKLSLAQGNSSFSRLQIWFPSPVATLSGKLFGKL